jgi:hypothetical protein
VTFTTTAHQRHRAGKIDREATVMMAHDRSDPLYLDGLAEGINLLPNIFIGGHAITAELKEEN